MNGNLSSSAVPTGKKVLQMPMQYKHNEVDRFGNVNHRPVTKTKQQKILKTARLYLQQNPGQALHACRFDVIAIEQGRQGLTITWLKSAFIDS